MGLDAGKTTLYICNTYYQLIVCAQLALTINKDCENHIILTNHSANSKLIARNLAKTPLFNSVTFWETKDLFDPDASLFEKTRMFLVENFGHVDPPPIDHCDEVFFFNYHAQIYKLADQFQKAGIYPEFIRFEESLISCNPDHAHRTTGRMRIADIIRKLTGRPIVSEKVREFYCFFPELCGDRFPLIPRKIPPLSETADEITTLLCPVFELGDFHYSQKYIFFASSSDIDGNGHGETSMIIDIARIVGEENLLVKMHPRDERSIYSDLGIRVMDNSTTPWELVQMSHNFDNRIFLASTSGSFLAASALLKNQPSSYFVEPKEADSQQKENWKNAMCLIQPIVDKLNDNGMCDNVKIINYDELIEKIQCEQA